MLLYSSGCRLLDEKNKQTKTKGHRQQQARKFHYSFDFLGGDDLAAVGISDPKNRRNVDVFVGSLTKSAIGIFRDSGRF